MKNIFNRSILIAALSLVFAGSAMATTDLVVSGSAVGAVTGAIHNTVSATSNVGGTNAPSIGTSNSFSASQAFSGGSVSAGVWNQSQGGLPAGAYQQSSAVQGSTVGWVNGSIGNVSTGTGTGSASMSGWSDSAVTGAVAGTISGDNGGQFYGTAVVDNGSITPVLHGPDVSGSASTNQGANGGAESGGNFILAGNINTTPFTGTVTSPNTTSSNGNSVTTNGHGGYVSDTLVVQTFANTWGVQGANPFGGEALHPVTVTALNAGANGNATLNGSFQDYAAVGTETLYTPSVGGTCVAHGGTGNCGNGKGLGGGNGTGNEGNP